MVGPFEEKDANPLVSVVAPTPITWKILNKIGTNRPVAQNFIDLGVLTPAKLSAGELAVVHAGPEFPIN